MDEAEELFERGEASEQPKKPYSTPVLVRHGTVEDLTGARAIVALQIDGASIVP
jgi:hypothetical protein